MSDAAIRNIDSYFPKDETDFQITAVGQATYFVGIFVMDVAASWQSVTVGYVVSSRSDFIVGNFIVGRVFAIQTTADC